MKLQRFPPKACIFLEGYQKKPKKKQRFWRFAKTLKSLFFCFIGTSSGNGNVFHQKLAFSWRGTKQTKKNKDFGLFRPRLRQDSKIFVFFVFFFVFLVPLQEMATFSTKSLHFPGRVPKNQKNKDLVPLRKWQRFPPKACIFLEGTKKPKNQRFWTLQASPRQDSKIFVCLVFFVPPHEMATFSTKSLHFPGGVPKKQKSQRFWTLQASFAKTLKYFVFFGFLVPPHEMATFSPKSLHFPGGVPKNQKKQRFWTLQASPSPRL